MIRAEGLVKRVGNREVLAGVDLSIARGELFCLVGPSGSGKTTLLRCLAGLDPFDRGRLFVGEACLTGGGEGEPRAIEAVRRRVGVVFQELYLFPHKTAIENVALAPRVVRGDSASAAEESARGLLRRVGLDGLADRYPGALSVGQKQRVAIARSLAMRPEVLLYDEPTSALDPNLVGEIVALMASLKAEGLTQVVVTHDMRFAREAADRAGYLECGRIAECGPASEVFARRFGPSLSEVVANPETGLRK